MFPGVLFFMETTRGIPRTASSGLTRKAPARIKEAAVIPHPFIMHLHTAITARPARAVSIPLDAWKKKGPAISRSTAVTGGNRKRAAPAASNEKPISTIGAPVVPKIEASAEGRSHSGLVNPDDGSALLKQRGAEEKMLCPYTRCI